MSLINTTLLNNHKFFIDYGFDLEQEINILTQEITSYPEIVENFPPRWVAIKLLEQDRDLQIKLLAIKGGSELIKISDQCVFRLRQIYGDDLDIHIADQRYKWIHQLVNNAVERPASASVSHTDKLDRILTHRYLGIPIFLAVMWAVFKLTAEVSSPYLNWIDGVMSGPITNWVIQIISVIGLSGSWLESLLIDGVIAGVGGVLVFVPVLTFLYISLAVLEDTGYMSRGAYVMDRLMSAVGLQGKSFLPMIVGFGCTVPAFYATRTLENDKDRILTGLLVPFMSCGARLPVYILFGAIFFSTYSGTIVFAMYLLGIVTALFIGLILRNTVFRGEDQSAMIIELPPYRIPNFKSVWIYVQKRVGGFLRNATTIIMVVSIILWFLMAIPVRGNGNFAKIDVDDSLFASIAEVVSSIFAPLGFGNWEATSALMSGLVAKEVVVSTLGQIYGINGDEEVSYSSTFIEDVWEIIITFLNATVNTIKSLPLIVGINIIEIEEDEESTNLMTAIQESFEKSSNGYGKLAGLAFMVFVLIYTPCMVALSAERQELGTKWMWVSIFGQFILAWSMALIVFQGGKFIGFG